MQTHPAKRVAIIIEAPMKRRLRTTLEAADVTGFTIVPVLGGSGRSGPWSREGQVGRAGGMVQVICVVHPDRLPKLLESLSDLIERHIGVVTISDCEVLRAERF